MSGLAGNNHSRPASATQDGPATRAGGGVLNLPNLVTGARLCAVPFAVWLTLHDRLAASFVVFGLAGLSDAVDGWLARRRGGSALGAVLDPLADKALLVCMFLALASIGILPAWLAALVVGRDALIVAGLAVLWLRRVPVRMRPLLVSKVNTALQLLLVAAALGLRGFALGGGGLLTALIWVVTASTLLSAAAYLRRIPFRRAPG